MCRRTCKMTSLLYISTIVSLYLCSEATQSCTTPDGTQGTCVGLDSCLYLADMLSSSPTQASFQYIQKSHCEGSEQYNVCCGFESTSSPIQESETEEVQNCQLTALPPEPSSECCGVDASGGGNRIVGGTATAVDEYPWLALIEYMHNNTIYLLCGGALISGKYVITAGHCIAGPTVSAAKPVKVRLGEYDTNNPGADCVEVEGGGEDCTDGSVSVRIEKIIPHPDYKNFIRPICLPTEDFTMAMPDQVTVYAAGWGAISDIQGSSNIKLKVGLPYLSYQKCQSSYNVPGRRVKLWEGQMCAGGVNGKDSCKGDSGGPLMRENGRLIELVGIVSFGPTPCGMENVAGVYTKVFHYLPWIKNQLAA